MAGLDGQKVEDLTRAEIQGRKHLHALVDFVRGQHARLRELLRRRRRAADRRAPDPPARGRIHPDQGGPAKAHHFADSVARGRDYYMPYRVLLPQKVDNLLVAGRHYSVTSQAQKISREIPPCMAMGEAAGVAAALAARARRLVRKVDVAGAAEDLRAQGADPGDQSGRNADVPAFARPALATSMTPSWRPSTAHVTIAAYRAERPAAGGVRVVDFTQVMMGPVCTQMLADYGADVLKIERKGAGDLSRSTFEPVHGADNPIFCSLNRNKRSAALDLRDPEGWPRCKALIAEADVVVNNFRAGVMERMGLGYEDCRALNPRIIYAVGTGYGDSGPYAHKGGQDVLAQAMSGVMHRRADPSVPMSIYPTALCRLQRRHAHGAGHPAGAAAARQDRRRPEGQRVAVQLDAGHADAGSGDDHDAGQRGQLGRDAAVRRVRHAGRRAGAGGRLQGQPAAGHLQGAGDRGPVGRPALLQPEPAVRNKPELQASSASASPATRRAYWLARLEEQDLLCAPVRDLREALVDPQTLHNRMLMEGPGEGADRCKLHRQPDPDVGRAKVALRHAPPRLGQHTRGDPGDGARAGAAS
jgi:crotonobetainyl-CoA:carnitine CoA-transferase CaiB-like acyl-CoA transferase